MIDLLISMDIELRQEEFIAIPTLRDLCDEVSRSVLVLFEFNLYMFIFIFVLRQLFEGKPMPLAPPRMTEEQLHLATWAALKVQNRWIQIKAEKRLRAAAEARERQAEEDKGLAAQIALLEAMQEEEEEEERPPEHEEGLEMVHPST